jgi:predicted DsbA family dithiol-disulfide isomerase
MEQTPDKTVRQDSRAEAVPDALLRVDFLADLVCPWSFMGSRRLREALKQVRGPAEVYWYPFQLNPDMPAEGKPFEQYVNDKFGSMALIEPALLQLEQAGRREGIRFDFGSIRNVPNTLLAHRAVKSAAEVSLAGEYAERLFSAFFEHGRDIGSRETLVEIAEEAGLAPDALRKTLDDENSATLVRAEEALARRSGMTGVPGFLLNRRLLVVGAQDVESLVNGFSRAMFGDEQGEEPEATIH